MASPRRRAPGTPGAGLSLYAPGPDASPCARGWRVNGFPARVLVWTDEQYRGLGASERPADAQHFDDCGV